MRAKGRFLFAFLVSFFCVYGLCLFPYLPLYLLFRCFFLASGRCFFEGGVMPRSVSFVHADSRLRAALSSRIVMRDASRLSGMTVASRAGDEIGHTVGECTS